jgi:hypothetical protein
VLPILVALWQTDATVQGAIEEQIQTSFVGAGAGALLTGGDLAIDAAATSASTTWGLRAGGRYAHALGFSYGAGAGTGADAPASNGSFHLAGTGSWQVTPRAQLGLDAQGSIASRFGLRAVDGAMAIDPFQVGNRLTYQLGGGASLFASVGKRGSLRLSSGYEQEGGLAADYVEAVGLDARTVRGQVGWGWDLGPSDTLVPELKIAQTHFEHAILDVDLRRGRVDTTAVTARVGDTHAFSRSLTLDVSLGATLSRSLVLEPAAEIVAAAPEAHAGLSWVGRWARVTGSYTLGFGSLGPRLAYGQQHSLLAELSLRPVSGAAWRDLLVHATARFAHGAAEVAVPAAFGSEAPAGRGWMTTTTAAAGALVEVPLLRAVSLRGGVDLQLARGALDPSPVGAGSSGLQLQTVVLIGIAGILSTDPARTVRKDPLEEEQARERAQPGAWQRAEDRAREYRPRAGDAVDPDLIDSDREPPRSSAEGDAGG